MRIAAAVAAWQAMPHAAVHSPLHAVLLMQSCCAPRGMFLCHSTLDMLMAATKATSPPCCLQIAKLSQAQTASGDASLQNALEMAVQALRSVPPYGHREVVMLFAALSTCDPGNVYEAVRACKDERIRVSVVGERLGPWPLHIFRLLGVSYTHDVA